VRDLVSNSRSAALIGFVLCLPIAILFSLVLLGIEPSLDPLDPLFRADGSHLSSMIVLGLLLLLPVALVINLAPIIRSARAGNGMAAHPVNLVLAVAILVVLAVILSSFIVDQYPCWIDVPNCD
jgi:hypothetical protein